MPTFSNADAALPLAATKLDLISHQYYIDNYDTEMLRSQVDLSHDNR
jgi:hypothetical protein